MVHQLEAIIDEQEMWLLRERRPERITLDIDTTVTPLFGHQEGAVPGSNPRYHGRPCRHPILARSAETDTVVGARLRPGDTALGDADAEDIEQWLDTVREAAGPKALITIRIDAGGDCAALLGAIHDRGLSSSSRRTKQGLCSASPCRSGAGTPSTLTPRANHRDKRRRSTSSAKIGRLVGSIGDPHERAGQRSPVFLWEDLDTVDSVYITNDPVRDIDDLARVYDKRAGIEPLIGELENGFAIGKASSSSFDANEAALLIKLLAYNLLRRWGRRRTASKHGHVALELDTSHRHPDSRQTPPLWRSLAHPKTPATHAQLSSSKLMSSGGERGRVSLLSLSRLRHAVSRTPAINSARAHRARAERSGAKSRLIAAAIRPPT
jgi:hypothetical protein